MLYFSKLCWILATIIYSFSILWYLFGATANFQRPLDLVTTVTFMLLWFPLLILTVSSIVLLLKGWNPSDLKSYVLLWVILLIGLQISVSLIKTVNTDTWFNDIVRSDPLKITEDEMYEYRVELINLFQRNSYARLYIKDLTLGTEIYIPVDINTREINVLRNLEGDDWAWAIMAPTDMPHNYLLTITENLRVSHKQFLIDIREFSSSKLE